MTYYNKAYSYPDLYLWSDEAWKNRRSKAAPLYLFLRELFLRDQEEKAPVDYYAGRQDEIMDALHQVPYFPEVAEFWEKEGMRLSSSGMMGLQLVPEEVARHEIYDPKVLLIPFVENRGNRHQGMNLVRENMELLRYAAREKILVQFQDCAMAATGAMVEKAIETQGTFRIRYAPLYLDISILEQHGLTIADVSGVEASEWKISTLAGRTVADITDKWQVSLAHQHEISVLFQQENDRWNWDFDRHIRSIAGKRQAEGMEMEYHCSDPHDPWMNVFFQEHGLRYEDHYLNKEWYVTLTPESVFVGPEIKIPLLIVMKEPRAAFPGTMLTAFQFYYDFIEICARGEFMMLYFALETPEDNDEVLPEIIEEMLEHYPIDESRVYLTGQSHNGYYALEFYRRHPKLIAAAATLSDPVGLQSGAGIDHYGLETEKLISEFRKFDYPLININGELENSYCRAERTPERTEADIRFFQNRMRAWKLPERSRKEILTARESQDYVTRRNGVPADRTEVRYMMGSELFLSDYYREDGRCYFRYVSIENTPHMIMPQMAELSWEFMRRFARDTDTGAVIERY